MVKRVKSLFRQRKLYYGLAALIILGINARALITPISDQVKSIYGHQKSVEAQVGVWDVTKQQSPVRSVHAALLRTGKVLLIAGSGNDQNAFNAKSFRTVIWDPKTNIFTEVPTPWDAFCAGHVFLPDGKLLVAGGTKLYEDLNKNPQQNYEGLKDSYEFDPITERYQKVSDLEYARWYPTLVGLGDGSVLASSGLDENGNILTGQTETFNPTTKQWTEQKQLRRYFPTYPALFLTGDGRLFYSGSSDGYGQADQGRDPGFWDLKNNSFQKVPGLTDQDMMETSASVLLPPAQDQRVMVLGGGGVGNSPLSTNRTAIVDLTKPNPTYVNGPILPQPTRYPGVVILPDDTVLETGGSLHYRQDDIFAATIFHPDTNTFTQAASPTVGRDYHSEALLLPDGRVATFGSNQAQDNSFEMRIEIYSPAYLFHGNRPQIVSGTTELQHGGTVNFKTTNPDDIKTAKLLRPSSVTHVTDIEQRSVNLTFTKSAGGISAQVPDNPNLLPPGWYMAFITNKANVPSEAYWVHVNG